MDDITTILKYGNEKHCLLTRAESYQAGYRRGSRINGNDEIVVYEAKQHNGSNTYFSVQGKYMELYSGDIVQLNRWYAIKLGFSDEEPLFLKRMKSVPTSAIRVRIEPLSVDEWEILESNAGYVETSLLHQIRVVWPGQVFPFWIQKSICIYLKICEVEPAAPYVVLENNTELVVAPKFRSSLPPSSLSLPSQETPLLSLPEKQNNFLAKKSLQNQTVQSPNKNWMQELTSSSENDKLDTLEPKPEVPSPQKSPRSSRRNTAQAGKNRFTSSFTYSERSGSHIPIVRRQSSLMESVMKYIFPFMSEKKEIPDNSSDSDKSSVMEFSNQNLPSRSGVLRVQPRILRSQLEECFPVNKTEVHKQIISRSMFGLRTSQHQSPFEPKIEAHKSSSIPLEIFQPSTVYVDAECTKNERLIHPYLPHLPHNFIARLQKLPSPQEKATALASRDLKKGRSENIAEPAQVGKGDSLENMTPGAASTLSSSESCYVRVVIIDRKAGLTEDHWQKAADHILSEQPLLHGHVIVSDLLRRQLHLEATSSVWIQTGPVDIILPRKVHIHVLTSLPGTIGNDLLIMAFRNYIKLCANHEHPLVVFQGIFLKFVIISGLLAEVQLTFYGDNDLFSASAVTMLSELNIDSVQLVIERNPREDKLGVINVMLPYSQIRDFDVEPISQKLKELGGMDNLAQQALHYLQASLASRPLSRHIFRVRGGLSHGILLITGPKGSGKTSLVRGLCRKMSHLPVLAHVTVVDCKTLRGKTVSTIQKSLEKIFDEAAWREPAVIVLENLEVIVPTPSGPETEITGESLYSAKNAQVLEGLIRHEIENGSRVTVIATSTSQSALHPSLVSSRGMHCIQQVLNIGSPDKDAREKILISILQRISNLAEKDLEDLDLSAIAQRTEGYVARDLELLVKRTLHAKISRDFGAPERRLTLTTDDFEEILPAFKPVSVRNVTLHKPGELGWNDVGGLDKVKTALIETLKWPTKYPYLFNSCSLRLRSGVLLYGAPGTGKTLLAGVVAKECGLNFISVKGPELLNKYIGASEQAVRDLFTKAQSAKPCILFFDEFDSIAPKRGHDSTGVTDRVVNQLLTQLDGVEGLQGVYVLAATSRPDLIDPALLRPGRLDISLYCDMPDENDRHNILIALTKKMSLAEDVDLKAIANACEHFTGADLKALLYNAQLQVIHEQTDSERSMNKSVVYIKGDSPQCSTTRRASVVHDAGSLTIQVSTRTSTEDCQSPRWLSRYADQSSPRQKVDHSGNHTPSSASSGKKTPSGKYDSLDDEIDSTSPRFWKLGKTGLPTQNIFQYPEDSTAAAGQKTKAKQMSKTDVEIDAYPETGLEIDAYPEIDVDFDAYPETGVECYPKILTFRSELNEDDVVSQGTAEERTSTFKDVDTRGSEDSGTVVADAVAGDVHTHDGTHPWSDNESASCERMPTKQGFVIPCSDELDSGVEYSTDISASYSDRSSFGRQRSSSAAHSKRRRRSYQRDKGSKFIQQTAIKVESEEVQSPSMEKPVTVFTSLQSGLATLSAEDQIRYLAMVKEMKERDERQFEAANDIRRTSVQLQSRLSVLMEVKHQHLLDAAQAMRPSVSASERERYMKIYDNFVSSRTVSFDSSRESHVGKRATLA